MPTRTLSSCDSSQNRFPFFWLKLENNFFDLDHLERKQEKMVAFFKKTNIKILMMNALTSV